VTASVCEKIHKNLTFRPVNLIESVKNRLITGRFKALLWAGRKSFQVVSEAVGQPEQV
jgi:hypothetical protein